MKQVKPEVYGYVCLSWNGHGSTKSDASVIYTKVEALKLADSDIVEYDVKSRFRPVYEKD